MGRIRAPNWISPQALLLLHQESLAEHGGLAGFRDPGAFEAALARPLHRFTYEPASDLARLATAYGFEIVRNHPFHDGNKRTGFLAIGLSLGIHGQEFRADPTEAIAAIMHLAEGKLTETTLARWIRQHMTAMRSK
jgi:death on curing protein